MAMKSDKEKKAAGKSSAHPDDKHVKKASSKPGKQSEEDELEEDAEPANELPKGRKEKLTSSKKSDKDDDEDEDYDEGPDEWEKPEEEEEEWDPDFDEFDLPKSKGGKGGKKKEGDDDLGIDDDFKEMGLFNDSYDDEDEDDF